MRRQALLLMVAVQFLTRLPAPTLHGYQPQWLSASARYFPLVGVLVGTINVVIWWLAIQVLPAAVSVGLMMAASLLVTGAFHEDGFADSCDGFGGGHTPQRMLEIMKDSRIGAYGAIGIGMMLGLKWATLTALPGASLPLLVVSAHGLSRWCATALICALPYVRVEDDAKAKPFASGLSVCGWLLSGVIGAVGCGGAAALLGAATAWHATGIAGGSPVAAAPAIRVVLCAAATALAITAIAAAYIRQRLGGYTGDCLGAVQQLTELGCLVAGLAVMGPA